VCPLFTVGCYEYPEDSNWSRYTAGACTGGVGGEEIPTNLDTTHTYDAVTLYFLFKLTDDAYNTVTGR